MTKTIERKDTTFRVPQHSSFGLRELKFADDGSEPEGTFTGYGSVFGNEDGGGDVVIKGAFKDTLRAWKAGKRSIKMLWQHGGGWGSSEGMLPIGKWLSMEEDDRGLKVKGQLIALDTDMGKRLLAALKSEQIDQMSIGYVAVDVAYGTKPGEPRRKLQKIDLFELSLVLFGMNDATSVDSVKSQIKTVRDFENFLWEVGGFSKAEAKRIASRGYKAADLRDEGDAVDALADLRKRAARVFSPI